MSFWSRSRGPRSARETPPPAQTPRFSEMNERKLEMAREGQDRHRTFTDPDPGRSPLCQPCAEFIKSLHSHPWNDAKRVASPIGASHVAATNQGYALQADWRPINFGRGPPQNCDLCLMVYSILFNNIDVWNTSGSDTERTEWAQRLIPTKYGQVNDIDPRREFGQTHNPVSKPHDRWSLGIEIVAASSKSQPVCLPCAIHCAPRPVHTFSYGHYPQIPFEHRPILHGRARSLTCDVTLLKSWPDRCRRFHGHQCQGRSNDVIRIRLIDVENDCLVQKVLGPSNRTDYIALSYVWGNKEQNYAPSAEIYDALHQAGSLRNLWLSRTVADAMNLVKQLGYRYLWLDALCIQQTSTADKHDQIAQMGFVYQNAIFTIIAASGNDCDAGLPGFRPDTRFQEQTFVQAGDFTLMHALQSPGNKILTTETSKWAVRGWTLQEELLSARQLIFTSEHIWWRCPCATWNEDSQLETSDRVGFLLEGEQVKPLLEDRFSNLQPEQYFELVADYAQRHLSYPSDGMNAFSGILTILTKYSGNRFLWGLLIDLFERQLHWFGKASVRKGTRRDDFPTWSWVSYQGGISFGHYMTYNPVIECYMIHETASGYQTIRVTDLYKQPTHNSSSNNNQQLTVHIEAVQSRYPQESFEADFHLFFYTYSATFYLQPTGRLTLPHLAPRHLLSDEGVVYGVQPDYGYLVPSLDGPDLCEKGERECILLGRRPPRSSSDEPHMVVMLVQRTGGILRRLGIADVREEFWNMADKTWDLVALA